LRILVTNDDGVRAIGLVTLARALAGAGHDVLVVAPIDEASGAGAGVGPIHTLKSGIQVDKIDIEGLEGIETLAIDALPALAVIAACMGAFGPPPDLIAAGINSGRNIGPAVLHSGTVGAALTAAHFGRRGLAMSIQSGRGRHIHYEAAAEIALRVAPIVAEAPPRTVVNCNVPNRPVHEILGLRIANLTRSGLIRSALADADGPRVQLELGFPDPPPEDGSDEALTAAGFATMTPLVGVSEDPTPVVRSALEQLVDSWSERVGASRTG
jgi:5'-nucleotidase